MPRCKNCGAEHAVKNGKVRGKQRFRCKECGLNFVVGDARTNEKSPRKKQCLSCFTLWESRLLICLPRYLTHGLPKSIAGWLKKDFLCLSKKYQEQSRK